MSRLRIAGAVSGLVGMLAACASVADLDVKYQPEVNSGDGGGADSGADSTPPLPQHGPVRDSSAVIIDVNQPTANVSTVLPSTCALGNLDEGGTEVGCDTAAGRGCCLTKAADNQCLEQKDLDSCGAGGSAVFVGCLRGSPDTPCCWRESSGALRVALPCSDGGIRACLDDSDCPAGSPAGICKTTPCKGGVVIGQCGDTPPRCE